MSGHTRGHARLCQPTPLPLWVSGVSWNWWTLRCPARLVDSLRKAPHWLNGSLSCSQCQFKVSTWTLAALFFPSTRRCQEERLCHEYKCVIISPSPPIALSLKTVTQLLMQSLALAANVSLSSPLASPSPVGQTRDPLHVNKTKQTISQSIGSPSLISLHLLQQMKTTKDLSPHEGPWLWWSGANEIRLFMYRKAGERKRLLCGPLEGVFQTKRREEMKEWGQLSVWSTELDKWLDGEDRLIFLCWTWQTWMMHVISCSSECRWKDYLDI